FDYCGAVNALYADPAPDIGIAKVTERKYMGFPRSIEEINKTLATFKQKESAIYKLINDFEPLKKPGKDEMTAFIKEFFELIKDQEKVRQIFVDRPMGK
ncbi:MAG TPA: hypothetical protein VK907_10260, partial [Phnomibacter sp.]|nr:hypothetical protein [Phnomibacter sp.]